MVGPPRLPGTLDNDHLNSPAERATPLNQVASQAKPMLRSIKTGVKCGGTDRHVTAATEMSSLAQAGHLSNTTRTHCLPSSSHLSYVAGTWQALDKTGTKGVTAIPSTYSLSRECLCSLPPSLPACLLLPAFWAPAAGFRPLPFGAGGNSSTSS